MVISLRCPTHGSTATVYHSHVKHEIKKRMVSSVDVLDVVD